MLKKILFGLFASLVIATAGGGIVQALPLVPHGAAAASSSQQASIGNQIVTRTKASWPWYISRGSGMIAAFLLVVLMLSGIGLLTGYTYKVLEPLAAWTTHRAVGLAFGVSVVVHMLSLLFDKFAPFTLLQIFVPFTSGYKPVTIAGYYMGSFWVALGVFAFYGVLLVVLTSVFWIDKRPYFWRVMHFLSYVIMASVFFHALFIGTDFKGGTYRVLWVFGGLLVAIAVCLRLWRAWTIRGR